MVSDTKNEKKVEISDMKDHHLEEVIAPENERAKKIK
jgi:hypothetical protein